MIQQTLLWAAAGTGFTFLMTTLGAAMVFFMKRQSSALMQQYGDRIHPYKKA